MPFSLGWCVWDLPALIVLAVIVVVFVVHSISMKKREKAFEEELAKADVDAIIDKTKAKP